MSIDTMNLEEYRELEPLYDQAKTLALGHETMSISRMQRELMIGYNRAARLCERLEEAGLLVSDYVNGGWRRAGNGS